MYEPLLKFTPEGRRRLFSKLDAAENLLIGGQKVLLGTVALAAALGLVYIATRMPEGGGSQGEWFYVGAALVLVLLGVLGQHTKLKRRMAFNAELQRQAFDTNPLSLSQRAGPAAASSVLRHLAMLVDRMPDGKLRTSAGSTREITFSIESPAPQVFHLDAAQLAEARAKLRRGDDLEEVMKTVLPGYSHMGEIEKQLFRSAFKTMLKAESAVSNGSS